MKNFFLIDNTQCIRFKIKSGELRFKFENCCMDIPHKPYKRQEENIQMIPLGSSDAPFWQCTPFKETLTGASEDIYLGQIRLLEDNSWKLEAIYTVSFFRENIDIIFSDDLKLNLRGAKSSGETKIALLLKYLRSIAGKYVTHIKLESLES